MSLLEINKRIVDEVIKRGAYQTEVISNSVKDTTTRFTKNAIHQNMASHNQAVSIKAILHEKKIGIALVNSLDKNTIINGIERAMSMAKVSPSDPDFKSLPDPKNVTPLKSIYYKETAEYDPEEKAKSVKLVIDTASDYNTNIKWSAGLFTTQVARLAIANSLGLGVETEYTNASLEVITRAQSTGSEGSGFAVKRVKNAKEIDFTQVALKAADDAVTTMNPQRIPLGEYEAIFRPEAGTLFTDYIGSIGFSSKSYNEGQSPLIGKLGTQLFDEKLTIWDNGRSLDTNIPQAFDGEGTPKRALMLLNGGVPENLCYDNYNALKQGRESTGHAPISLGGPRDSPSPIHKIVDIGDASIDEMIEETRKGVLITRFWYVRTIRPDLGTISGMTCDGVWYIENGEIKHPSQQMRFTDSFVSILQNIRLIGKKSTNEITPSTTLPALKTAHFRFTGHTDF
ncbi:TldD/PmbA family protein [Candidatus Bathyarchaeota archaeon]|nr:TldD/PmbA family protein [Candidatus Bathyarchaeota archaeon]